MKRLFIISFLLFQACAPKWADPPTQVSIDPTFTSGQKVIIRDTLDAWCGAVGWCPKEVTWGEANRGNYIRDNDFRYRNEPQEVLALLVDENDVHVNASHPSFNDPVEFWIAVAHEAGHWGIGPAHTSSGLMGAYHDPGDVEPEIDREAVKAWQSQSN